jgi:hypothetical protein
MMHDGGERPYCSVHIPEDYASELAEMMEEANKAE